MSSSFFALAFTVVLLVTTAYFIMGGLPLLVLQHDTPVDGRFVSRFFEVYYKAALIAAVGSCVSYAAWGRLAFAGAAAVIGVVVVVLRRVFIPTMERLGARIQDSDPAAIAAFRKVHSAALLVNLAQLVVLVWGMTRLSL